MRSVVSHQEDEMLGVECSALAKICHLTCLNDLGREVHKRSIGERSEYTLKQLITHHLDDLVSDNVLDQL